MATALAAKVETKEQIKFGAWVYDEDTDALNHPFTWVNMDGATENSIGRELAHLRQKPWFSAEQNDFVNAYMTIVRMNNQSA